MAHVIIRSLVSSKLTVLFTCLSKVDPSKYQVKTMWQQPSMCLLWRIKTKSFQPTQYSPSPIFIVKASFSFILNLIFAIPTWLVVCILAVYQENQIASAPLCATLHFHNLHKKKSFPSVLSFSIIKRTINKVPFFFLWTIKHFFFSDLNKANCALHLTLCAGKWKKAAVDVYLQAIYTFQGTLQTFFKCIMTTSYNILTSLFVFLSLCFQVFAFQCSIDSPPPQLLI